MAPLVRRVLAVPHTTHSDALVGYVIKSIGGPFVFLFSIYSGLHVDTVGINDTELFFNLMSMSFHYFLTAPFFV